MKHLAAGALLAWTSLFSSVEVQAADRTMIVLDASGSMWGQIEGKPKLEIARETLRTVLQTVPSDIALGLMAYGHREKGNCADIELVVEPATGTGTAISDAAGSMRFLGKTPLSEAVKRAAEALRYTEDKATVVLVTDGIETCNADPCALGLELERSGVDFTAHVVGFGLSREEGREVACLAENTGGRYIQASDGPGLSDALTQTVVAEAPAGPAPAPAPEPEAAAVFNIVPTVALSEDTDDLGDDAGNAYEVYRATADGQRGDYVSTDYGRWRGNLEPGDYVVVARYGQAEVEQTVTIKAGAVAKPHFVLNAGRLIIRPLPNEGAEVPDGATTVVDYPGEGEATIYGVANEVFPAGEQIVTVSIGKGEVTETIALAAGETVERDIVIGVGRVVLNAFYVPGMRVEEGGVSFEVLKAAKNMDGSRESISYGYGPDNGYDLPAGDYIAVGSMGEARAEAPFAIKVGERVDVEIVLNAGVLAASAPGANSIEILSAAKDIQGNRKSVSFAYGEAHQTTLPAGDYVVVRELPDNGGRAEAPATIKAGERAEVTVP
ncbi:VWA domain-containing protein [Mesorhizobium sp. CAU 1741]|uniref:vWA domain-containing protein n=1 Tax=Mesorhizobium sp. CAU 1741 TaxID=3140366 RepID=UPI00325C0AED